MRKHDFEYVIPASYFPDYKVIKPYGCLVWYEANSLGYVNITLVGFDPKMPMMNNGLYSRLIVEIEGAAKDHYESLGIEQPDYNDIEMQEKYLTPGD